MIEENMKFLILILITLILNSCFDRKPSPLNYITQTQIAEQRALALKAKLAKEKRIRDLEEKLRQEKFESEKKLEWERITIFAKDSFENIKPILQKKCFDCHHENRKLPLYARMFRRYNPLFRHQKQGLRSIDFSQTFPLRTSSGYSYQPKDGSINKISEDNSSSSELTNIITQIAYLKAFKKSITDRSMPIRSYTFVYRYRKIRNNEELKIINWTDPLIAELSQYKRNYLGNIDDGSMRFKANQIFAAKCIRCHNNNTARGKFSGVTNLYKLKKSKFIDKENPEDSELFKLLEDGEMPTDPGEKLTSNELLIVLDWIKEADTKD